MQMLIQSEKPNCFGGVTVGKVRDHRECLSPKRRRHARLKQEGTHGVVESLF